MKQIKKFKMKDFKKNGGRLIAIPFNKKFFFKVERIFYIYGKKFLKRGNHAHKKCSQVFIPIMGKIKLTVKSVDKTKIINLDHRNKNGVLIPPKLWCGVDFLTDNSVLMVICDMDYDYNDYLETFEDFIKYKKKNK